jgi:hypothetical protein
MDRKNTARASSNLAYKSQCVFFHALYIRRPMDGSSFKVSVPIWFKVQNFGHTREPVVHIGSSVCSCVLSAQASHVVTLTMKIHIFWDITPCSPLEVNSEERTSDPTLWQCILPVCSWVCLYLHAYFYKKVPLTLLSQHKTVVNYVLIFH